MKNSILTAVEKETKTNEWITIHYFSEGNEKHQEKEAQHFIQKMKALGIESNYRIQKYLRYG